MELAEALSVAGRNSRTAGVPRTAAGLSHAARARRCADRGRSSGARDRRGVHVTGFPFLEGAARIYQLDSGLLVPVADGLTNIVDLAFGPDGSLFALEIDSNGLFTPGGSGALFKIGADGSKTLLFDGLVAPTGLAIGANGNFYISTNGTSPMAGSVMRLEPGAAASGAASVLGRFGHARPHAGPGRQASARWLEAPSSGAVPAFRLKRRMARTCRHAPLGPTAVRASWPVVIARLGRAISPRARAQTAPPRGPVDPRA